MSPRSQPKERLFDAREEDLDDAYGARRAGDDDEDGAVRTSAGGDWIGRGAPGLWPPRRRQGRGRT